MTNTALPALAAELHGEYRMETIGRTAEVFLYGSIGGWSGVRASDFVRAIAELDVDTIELRVNSPGGVVYDGVAMMNALRRHKARVVATVDGLAASAASFLIMAADEVVMGRGTELMIHDAWNIAWGPAADLRKEADHLDKISQTVASVYAERAGGDATEWRDAMLAETWYSAEEAVTAGLADRVAALREADPDDPDEVEVLEDDDGDLVALADAAGFRHHGRADAPDPFIPTRTPSTAAAGPRPSNQTSALAALAALTGAVEEPPAPPAGTHPSTGEEAAPMSDLKKKLGERLGVPAAAEKTDDEILAAVDEALQEQAEPGAAAAGVVQIDTATLDGLRADAAAGRAAREQQEQDAREALVTAAVNDGRISPSRHGHWVNALKADAGAAETLASLEKGLVPLQEKGFVGGADESTDEDGGLYAKAWGADEQKGA